jgi:transmembrane sensor
MNRSDREDTLRIAEQAAEWLYKLENAQSDTSSETEDRTAFLRWLTESPAHVRELLAVSAVMSAVSELSARNRTSVPSELPAESSRPRVVPMKQRVRSGNALHCLESAVEVEASSAQWLIRLDAQGSPEKWGALDAWLGASPRHRAAFLRLSHAWTSSDWLRKLRAMDAHVEPDLLSPAAQRKRESKARRFTWLHSLRPAARASAILATALVGVGAWLYSVAADTAIYRTAVGEFQALNLKDGSSVRLNTDSVIRVRYTDSSRGVRLVSGEALFRVASDVNRPFDVTAGLIAILGNQAEFSVRLRNPETIEVAVLEGRVAIKQPSATTVAAGHIAYVTGDMVRTALVGEDGLKRRYAWTDGRLSFLGETLQQAIDEINRYNRTRLEIADPETGRLRVSGVFSATDPELFVATVSRELGIHATTSTSKSTRKITLSRPEN